MNKVKDLKNQRFGQLTVIRNYITITNTRNRQERKWLCRCDCGTEKYILERSLLYGGTKSCGCQRREHEQSLSTYLTHVNGTSLDMIRSKKVPNDNTTGYRGVYLIKGKYVAKIVFQKKAYYLGVYDDIEEAAQARKEAEELLFDGATAHYERWKSKADADPEWAEQNPVQILVSKKSASELSVVFLPVIA